MINEGNIKISIQKSFLLRTTLIFIWQEHSDGSFEDFQLKDGQIVVQRISKEDSLNIQQKPFIELPTFLADKIFKSVIKFNEENGIRSENEFKLQGFVEAKSEHIKDLQLVTSSLLSFIKDNKNAL